MLSSQLAVELLVDIFCFHFQTRCHHFTVDIAQVQKSFHRCIRQINERFIT